MRFSRSAAVAVAAAALPVAFAQTFTDCNPTEKSCPSDPGLNAASFSADFTQGSSANTSFSAAAYSTINYGPLGMEFTISQEKQAPTIQTDFYFLFGRVDVKMRASPGQGIISSIVLQSDDLDEIDWEFVGGDTAQVQSNFFGKGNTTLYNRVQYIKVGTPQDTFHTYSLDWTAERLQYIIDGTVVRTLPANDPLTNGGSNYPQTPMRLKLGSWCGGCTGSPEGTVEWAGGKTTFEGAPFNMYVASVNIKNNNPASSYTYGDMSGTWGSIKINGGSGSSESSSSTSSSATTMVTVAPIVNTEVAASTTITGSSYSMNSASVSAQNAFTSGATVSTKVPQPTTKTASLTTPTGNAAAGAPAALTGASLFGIALGLFML